MAKINGLSREITKALETYTEEVTEGLEEAKETVAKSAAKKLKQRSPKDTGDYARGWRAKKVGNGWVVHNATNYQLTHLLEHGHAKRGGGRVAGIPHIGPVEEEAIQEYVQKSEK
ncbi:HK97 gp10 family phage protein, partial [Paludifilum halophilum]